MSWQNNDGLYVKFGVEEGQSNKGGTYLVDGPLQITEFKFDYTDCVLASSILGSIAGPSNAPLAGAAGILFPRGVRIEAVEVVAETAFTSSGTIGSATLDIGLIRNDRSTAYDDDGFVAALAFSALDSVGERQYITKGGTGAGAFIGTTLANSGWIVLNNDQHASHPLTAGKGIVRIYHYTPQTIG